MGFLGVCFVVVLVVVAVVVVVVGVKLFLCLKPVWIMQEPLTSADTSTFLTKSQHF